MIPLLVIGCLLQFGTVIARPYLRVDVENRVGCIISSLNLSNQNIVFVVMQSK